MITKEQYQAIWETAYKWDQLSEKVDAENKFDLDLFQEAFRETFGLLQGFSCRDTVDKYYMKLFLAAYEFSFLRIGGICKEHDAAVELTATMLKECCLYHSETPVTHWIGCGVQIPYEDVDTMLATLAEEYAEDYPVA